MKDFAIQLSHRPGELARVTNALSLQGVNIRSIAAIMLENKALLRLIPDERGSMLHEGVFRQYLRKHTLLNIRTRREGEILELSYFVRLKSPEQTREFVRSLGAIEGVEGVSLIAMEETAEA